MQLLVYGRKQPRSFNIHTHLTYIKVHATPHAMQSVERRDWRMRQFTRDRAGEHANSSECNSIRRRILSGHETYWDDGFILSK